MKSKDRYLTSPESEIKVKEKSENYTEYLSCPGYEDIIMLTNTI